MNRKLTMSTIQKIRRLYKTRKYKQAYLASIHNVSSAQIKQDCESQTPQNPMTAYHHQGKEGPYEPYEKSHGHRRGSGALRVFGDRPEPAGASAPETCPKNPLARREGS